MSVRPTEDPIAHDLLVKGTVLSRIAPRLKTCRAPSISFNRSSRRDANYAAAYAGLGEAYIVLPRYTAADRKRRFPKANAAAL